VDSSTTALVRPVLTFSIVLNVGVIAELGQYLDMTAEFCGWPAPRRGLP
jgi:hypothetical protein